MLTSDNKIPFKKPLSEGQVSELRHIEGICDMYTVPL